jgi:hypothetical protein
MILFVDLVYSSKKKKKKEERLNFINPNYNNGSGGSADEPHNHRSTVSEKIVYDRAQVSRKYL